MPSTSDRPVFTPLCHLLAGLVVAAVWTLWCLAGAFGVVALVVVVEVVLPPLVARLPDAIAIVDEIDRAYEQQFLRG